MFLLTSRITASLQLDAAATPLEIAVVQDLVTLHGISLREETLIQ